MTVKMIIIASLLISSGITLSLSFYASRKLRSIGSVSYILLMISISFYSLGYAFELYNTTVEGIYLAIKIEYIGITTMPTFWVILTLILHLFFLQQQARFSHWPFFVFGCLILLQLPGIRFLRR